MKEEMQCGQSMGYILGMHAGDVYRDLIGGSMTFCLCNVKIFNCLPIYLFIVFGLYIYHGAVKSGSVMG